MTDSAWHPHLWHPLRRTGEGLAPLAVRRGRGVWLELEDGRQLIDAISSWWVTLHGHGEPTIAAAIAAQARSLEQVIFADFRHGPAALLAERLCGHWPGLSRVFFSDDGSTAVEVALKLAWQHQQRLEPARRQLIAFEGAYHGDTVGAMAVGSRGLFNAPFEPLLFPVARAPWPSTWWDDDGVDARESAALLALEALLQTPTVAVILEPLVQGAGGMAMVRPSFLQGVAERTRAAGALLIADEVLTGFSRTGDLFACLSAGLTPDLVALSKGLTGGFLPMSVTLASEALHDSFCSPDPASTFFHGHSFTANPLGCAAALASLDLLEADPDRPRRLEQLHRPRLQILAGHPLVQRPRLLGTIAAFDLQGPSGYLQPAGRELQRLCLAQGVYLRPLGSVVYLMPPLVITAAELDRCYAALQQGLAQLNPG